MESNLVGGTNDRRREERRTNAVLAELTLPEVRRIVLTWLLTITVVFMFLWMVRDVLIAAILAVIIAIYLRPFYLRVLGAVKSPGAAAILALLIFLLPVIGALAYSYQEMIGVVEYVSSHQDEVASRINLALRRLPFLQTADIGDTVRQYVLQVSNYGQAIPGILKDAVIDLSVAATIFMFTAFYVCTQAVSIVSYVRGKIPPRYGELRDSLVTNVRGVLYGAIYATLVTQTLKSTIILLMNLVFGVPLAAVLAIVSFVIGFFPIVGSWSVYVPVAAWLLVFRDRPGAAFLMIVVGFVLNTVFISTFLRPKLAADKSRVLNFYWMFVGLVTGVYTFGLAGILLGPILIGMLKAVMDTVTATSSWRLIDLEDGEPEGAVEVVG